VGRVLLALSSHACTAALLTAARLLGTCPRVMSIKGGTEELSTEGASMQGSRHPCCSEHASMPAQCRHKSRAQTL